MEANMRIFECLASAGRIKVIQTGEGNGTMTTFRLLGGGQFQFSEVKKLADGVEITISGEWELNEFATVAGIIAGILPHPIEIGEDNRYVKEISPTEEAAGFIMPFGKHKGKALADCPEDYIRWVAENLTDRKIRDRAIALVSAGKPPVRPGDAFLERP